LHPGAAKVAYGAGFRGKVFASLELSEMLRSKYTQTNIEVTVIPCSLVGNWKKLKPLCGAVT
jgi:hypothetical protein